MRTYVLRFEIIYVRFEDQDIDITEDTRDVVAADDQSAIESIRDEIEYRTELDACALSNVEVIGAIEDETF
jgi:hypothetical protein